MLRPQKISFFRLFHDTALILIVTAGIGIYWSITLLFSPRLLPLLTHLPGVTSLSEYVDNVFTRPSVYESGKNNDQE
jgi:hypothetical protein